MQRENLTELTADWARAPFWLVHDTVGRLVGGVVSVGRTINSFNDVNRTLAEHDRLRQRAIKPLPALAVVEPLATEPTALPELAAAPVIAAEPREEVDIREETLEAEAEARRAVAERGVLV